MIKNDPVASRRRLAFMITTDDGVTPAPRGTDFTGCTWLDQSTGSLVVSNNNLVNSRRELTFTTFTFTADSTTDQLHAVAHGFETGDGPIRPSNSGGALPAPLVAGTGYYVIKVDADNFKVAATLADAYAGTAIDLTTNGTGTQSIVWNSSFLVQRGLDGDFWLQLDQAETLFDGDYLLARVEKATFAVARAYAKMDTSSAGDRIIGDGITADQALLAAARGELAKKLKVGTTITTRDILDTKNSHHGDVTPAGGRITAVIDDLT